MKILFPIGSFYPAQMGGPSNTIYWIAKELVNKNIAVKVVTTSQGILQKHKIEVNRWQNLGYGDVIYVDTIFHYLPVRFLYHSIKAMRNVDVIHLTALFHPLSWITAIVNSLFYKKRIIWSVRGELSPAALKFNTWKKKPVIHVINNYLKNRITFHATSEEETEHLKLAFGKKISIIHVPNYCELPSLCCVEKGNAEKENYFLFLGRLHPIKGIENLLEALSLSKTFLQSNFKLIIAGSGDVSYASALKEQVLLSGLSEKVSFIGHQEGEDKQKLLSKAYFLFLPSHAENFGNVVVEALGQKTPVVASLGTPWRLLALANAGYWVSNETDSMIQIIDQILTLEKDNYEKMCDNALILAQQKFDVKSHIDSWISVYKNNEKCNGGNSHA